MTFGDLDLIMTSHDVRNAFSVHRSPKIHLLKICTWWPLVTLTLLWPPIMFKMIFLCVGAPKYTLKICTWWPLVTLTLFGTPMMPKMPFSMYRSLKIHFLKNSTSWPLATLTLLWPTYNVQTAFSVHKSPKIHFWKFTLDDLLWPWPYFDLPWCPKCFFCA